MGGETVGKTYEQPGHIQVVAGQCRKFLPSQAKEFAHEAVDSHMRQQDQHTK
jgi:hypothetical protein